MISLVCHALLTCLLLASHHKNHAFFDHHLGPWFEGFTFITDCTKDPERKSPNLPETSKQHQMALLTHLGEWTCWGGELLLAMASRRRAEPPVRPSSSPCEQFTRRGELWQSSNFKIDIFDLKTSNQASPSAIWPLGSLETYKNSHGTSTYKYSKHGKKWGN